MTSQKIAPFKAFYWILASIFVVTGGAAFGLQTFMKWQKGQMSDPKFLITRIIQTGPQKEPLTTEYLSELLSLSKDKPSHLLSFDIKKAQRALLSSPLIKEASVSTIRPSTVYVDYAIRKPLAWLYEYENVGIDDEGFIFPVYPFFTPKQLPELYVGLEPFGQDSPRSGKWNVPLQGKYIDLGIELLKLTGGLNVRRVDVSNAYASTLGAREIVLYIEDEILSTESGAEHLCIFPRLVRLSTKNYHQEISNFLSLRDDLLKKEKEEARAPADAPFIYTSHLQVIDLRIEGMGVIKTINKSED